MDNWYTEMDLMCTPKTVVAQMFSWTMIGILVGLLFAPLAEKVGRKKTIVAGMLLSLGA